MINDMEFERLMDDLERLKTATNVHTINKARMYLASFFKGAWWLKSDDERKHRLEAHVARCREAVSTGDIEKLRYSMRRLF